MPHLTGKEPIREEMKGLQSFICLIVDRDQLLIFMSCPLISQGFVILAQTVKYHSMWTDMVRSAWEKSETQGSAEDIEKKSIPKRARQKLKKQSKSST